VFAEQSLIAMLVLVVFLYLWLNGYLV